MYLCLFKCFSFNSYLFKNYLFNMCLFRGYLFHWCHFKSYMFINFRLISYFCSFFKSAEFSLYFPLLIITSFEPTSLPQHTNLESFVFVIFAYPLRTLSFCSTILLFFKCISIVLSVNYPSTTPIYHIHLYAKFSKRFHIIHWESTLLLLTVENFISSK